MPLNNKYNLYISQDEKVLERCPDGFTGKCVIPEGIQTIKSCAFQNCSSLEEVHLPETLQIIQDRCFEGCSTLREIHIPDNVIKIGERVFEECHSLEKITVAEGNKKYDSREDCNAIVETKENMVIVGCKSTTIPGSIERIAPNAFDAILGLFILREGKQNLDQRIPINEIWMPETIEVSCGDENHPNNSSQSYSYFDVFDRPDFLSIIDGVFDTSFAHEYLSDVEKISVDKHNKRYDSRNNCNAIIETATNILYLGCKNTSIPEEITEIGNGAFECCGCPSVINLSKNVSIIGENAFSFCSRLKHISIPKELKEIGPWAFFACDSLLEIDLPKGITMICENTFDGCSALKSISVPENVKTIREEAFMDCSSLEEVVLPNGLISIGDTAFGGCSALKEICLPATIESVGHDAFYGCSSLKKIYIPKGQKQRFIDMGLAEYESLLCEK